MDYSQNLGIISEEENIILQNKNVIVIGAGGLGGYILNGLTRLGIKNISIVDFDFFTKSNLNRQLFSSSNNLGKLKTEVLKKELEKINPDISIKIFTIKLDHTSQISFDKYDIIIDAVDSIKTKLLIEKIGTRYNLPIIHGAIGGWYGQVGIVLPNSNILSEIYYNKIKGIEKTLKFPTFIPGIVGNIMVSEFVKFSLNKNSLLNKILYIDVLDHDYLIIYSKPIEKK